MAQRVGLWWLLVPCLLVACGDGAVGDLRVRRAAMSDDASPGARHEHGVAHVGVDGSRHAPDGVRYHGVVALSGGREAFIDFDLPSRHAAGRPALRYRERGGSEGDFDGRARWAAVVLADVDCACHGLRFEGDFVDAGQDGERGSADDRVVRLRDGVLDFGADCDLPPPIAPDSGVEVRHVDCGPRLGGTAGFARADAERRTSDYDAHRASYADDGPVIVVITDAPPPAPRRDDYEDDTAAGCEADDHPTESAGCEADDHPTDSAGCESDSGGGWEGDDSDSAGCEADDSDSSGCEPDSARRGVGGADARLACIVPRRRPYNGPVQNYLSIALAVGWLWLRKRHASTAFRHLYDLSDRSRRRTPPACRGN